MKTISGLFQRIHTPHPLSGLYVIVLSQEREGNDEELISIPTESTQTLRSIDAAELKKGNRIIVYLDDRGLCVGFNIDERCSEDQQ